MKARATLLIAALPLALAGLAGCTTASPSRATASDAADTLRPCEEVTGTRIRTPEGSPCRTSSAAVRSYSAEELEATGAPNPAEALRRLDPSLQ